MKKYKLATEYANYQKGRIKDDNSLSNSEKDERLKTIDKILASYDNNLITFYETMDGLNSLDKFCKK